MLFGRPVRGWLIALAFLHDGLKFGGLPDVIEISVRSCNYTPFWMKLDSLLQILTGVIDLPKQRIDAGTIIECFGILRVDLQSTVDALDRLAALTQVR